MGQQLLSISILLSSTFLGMSLILSTFIQSIPNYLNRAKLAQYYVNKLFTINLSIFAIVGIPTLIQLYQQNDVPWK